MLTSSMRRRAVAAVAAAAWFGGVPAADAAPVECPINWVWNGGYQACTLTAGHGGVGGGGGGTNPGGGGGGELVCMYNGAEIPCRTDDGYWVGPPKECYVKRTDPQPPKSDPVWPKNPSKGGAVYTCSKRFLAGNNNLDYIFWWPTPPQAAGVSREVLLAQAVSRMGIRGIEMGSTPPMIPGRVGLIGFPVWLWAANPGPQTWGPVSASASAGGATVTARAEATRVQWEMGNGDVVTCAGPGLAWSEGWGREPSPQCGYRYEHDGTYRVQAVTFWELTWSGMGQQGTIPLAVFSRGELVEGEAQVLVERR